MAARSTVREVSVGSPVLWRRWDISRTGISTAGTAVNRVNPGPKLTNHHGGRSDFSSF